ncbi:hypothetical protein N7519_008185 [Penicillium mononematosum]|uniref:uncharacterized protein n=1 Tax=Penicillium mononematosum TaxID=268346 RepID=UPI0025493B84|nr:uncharacterized protein N7519_008185 [Penicillium mononematosum]KAJ6177724.1 hypothetical protein N7519_008185 [Penicillium mononematosum]
MLSWDRDSPVETDLIRGPVGTGKQKQKYRDRPRQRISQNRHWSEWSLGENITQKYEENRPRQRISQNGHWVKNITQKYEDRPRQRTG